MRARPVSLGRLVTALAVTTLATIPAAVASSPAIKYIFPAGAQRGTSIQVIVGGNYLYQTAPWEMSGPGITASKQIVLAEKQIWFEGPRIPMPDSQRGEDYPKDQLGTVAVAADARLGHRYFRVWTSEGVTPTRRFVIGHLPEIVEQEIDGRPIPTPVKLPVTINGRMFPREDVDIWTFEGRKGHSYICEVNAARIGSPLDSRLEVVGPDGLRVAENTDHFGNDSYLRFTAPADGVYRVRIHDLTFMGLQHYVYRLTISGGPWVEQVYPLGVQRGTANALRLAGQHLPSDPVQLAVPADAPDRVGHTFDLPGGRTNVVELVVSDLPNVLETDAPAGNNTPATAQKVTLPAVLNGRIENPGDQDAWRIKGKKGDQLILDVQAARRGTPLDAKLEILDADGKVVASGIDAKSTSDPTVNFKFPADGSYVVVISEQEEGRGGPRFAYRIEVAPPPPTDPGFRVTLPGDAISVPRGGEIKFKVGVIREGGFADEVALSVENLPPGVTVSGGDKIPKGKPNVELKLKATKNAQVEPRDIRIVGQAKVGDADVSSVARILAATIHDTDRDSVKLTASVPVPFKFTGVFQSSFGPQGSAFYRHYTIVRGDFKGPLTATIADTQGRHLQGVTCRPMKVPDNSDQFTFRIELPTWLEVGRTSRTQMLLVGQVVDPDGTRHTVSYTSNGQSDQTVVLATSGVVGVNTSLDSISARPGGTVELPVTVSRGTGAGGPGVVELLLPDHIQGVSATPVKLAAGQTTCTLKLRFAKSGLGPFNQPLTVQARIPDARGDNLLGATKFEVVVNP